MIWLGPRALWRFFSDMALPDDPFRKSLLYG
jgi:hypothetical protein